MVAPSGECLRDKDAGLAESNGGLLPANFPCRTLDLQLMGDDIKTQAWQKVMPVYRLAMNFLTHGVFLFTAL